MLIRKLFRTAWSYKSQFISMVIMITIGVGIFLGFNIEWKSLETDAFSFLENTSYADYRIYSENGFTEEEIKAIQSINGVDAATRYLNVNVSIKDTKKSLALNVSENYTVSKMLLIEGTEYNKDLDGIWLSDKFATANDIKIGDEITLIYTGLEITGKVIGLIKSGENMICVADENQLMPDYNTFGFAYITPKTLEKVLGFALYPQINIISNMEKEELEEQIKTVTGTTFLVTTKNEHNSYAGVMSEAEEGKTMGSILPVLFLVIAVLTMVTTMHRISVNEKGQIGTLKALGFHDSRILLHYTSYGFTIGLFGMILGTGLGFLVAYFIISPKGMMSTYLDMPSWDLVMPSFCIPVMILLMVFLTLISYLSVKKMLRGTAADALRPYEPKTMKKSAIEKISLTKKLSFGVKWNIRDISRHKSRSLMTVIGIIGCMVLLVGGLGMGDTMKKFLNMLDNDICNYNTKVILSETSSNNDSLALAEKLNGDWQASSGISYNGKTITMDIYSIKDGKIGLLTEDNKQLILSDEGVYLCLRLKNTAKVGDTITFSPYGSEKTYEAVVVGYTRSLVNECIAMSNTYADSIGIDYRISAIYTDETLGNIGNTSIISGKQDKEAIMDSYDSFMDLMNLMVIVLIIAAIVLSIVVLYNLGVMSYVERYRELATLKVLGFRDRYIGNLLISQNIWLTIIGVLFGIPAGIGILNFLITSLASEYEMSVAINLTTYVISTLLTFGVSLLVGLMISKKNKKIDMVEALKGTE